MENKKPFSPSPLLRFPKRAVHLDFHTMPGIDDLGSQFNGKEFAATLRDAGVEYVNVFAKCNLGFCYYPTKVGYIYPDLKRDLLGEMVDACHNEGIRVAAYFNVGLSHEHALRHRDWCSVNKLGQVYKFDVMNHWFRTMCFNSPYRDLILQMVDEVLEAYPVDGLLFDSLTPTPCYGIECVEKAEALGLDMKNDDDVRKLAFQSSLDMKDSIIAKATERRDNLFMYFLGLEAAYQPTHQELEVLPQGGWGYDYLPARIRYIRTLGKPYSTMTGRFQGSWGDLGGIRPEPALLYDCLNSVVNGGNCCIGDHLHPRCRLEPAVYKMIGNVYSTIAKLDEWTDGAKPVTEIAILAPWLVGCGDENNAKCATALRGYSRMLLELKQQFDVINAEADFTRYHLLILPDFVRLDAKFATKLQAYLEQGGKLISSAWAGLAPDGTNFVLPCHRKAMRFLGDEPCQYTFIHPSQDIAEDMPDIGTTIYNQGIAVEVKQGTPLAELGKGYFHLGDWDYKHEYLYIPEKELTGRPGIVAFAEGCHFTFPLGAAYFEHAACAYRTLLRNLLRRLLPNPLLHLENFPSFGQATITTQPSRRILHLLCYVPEKRGTHMEIVEEPSIALDVKAKLRLDGFQPTTLYLAPDRTPLPFTIQDDYATFTIPVVKGYAMAVLEDAR
ncbi:MAG: beta-galactosidase trimerization domain-containing protein [Victivallales bacterium]|nr:beta-galactosidase trimerization domain-containing protein [Victivallales bacterium]